MSKTGHTVCGLATAAAIFAATLNPALSIGTLVGANLPDAGEIVVGYIGWKRLSLLGHRTFTHTPLTYLVAAVFLLLLPMPYRAFGLGICAGAIVHLVLDAFTPMGIPMFMPWGTRISLGPYRTNAGKWYGYYTGTIGELPYIGATVIICAIVIALHLLR